MQIRIGYDIGYGADLATPMVIMLNVHPSRHGDLVGIEDITTAAVRADHLLIATASAMSAAVWSCRPAVW